MRSSDSSLEVVVSDVKVAVDAKRRRERRPRI